MKLTHRFVTNIPDQIEDGVIYISTEYATAIHNCCCGCKTQVVTPFSPTDWKLIFDGKTISLYPSIGNWSFECGSHYWITNSEVEWAPKWTRKEIEQARIENKLFKEDYLKGNKLQKLRSSKKIKRVLRQLFKLRQ